MFRLDVFWTAVALFLSLTFNLPIAKAQSAPADPKADCPADALNKLNQAKNYLVGIPSTLTVDFEIDSRRAGQDRRAARQIPRRLEKLQFKCKSDADCTNSTAVHSIVGGNVVRFCWNEMTAKNWRFCRMVDTVAHEFGHLAHIPRAKMGEHNRRGDDDPDRVYQFGFFAGDVCLMDRDPNARVNTPAAPDVITTPSPTSGIALFPRDGFAGRWRAFLPGEEDQHSLRGKHFWPDLRFIGRNDSFSSAKVYSGIWELCDKRSSSGRCIYLDANEPDFATFDFDNKISSIREFSGEWPPTEGIFLYAGKNYTSGGKFLKQGMNLNLRGYDLENEISSYQVVSGVWEGCEGPLYRGWCNTLTGDKPDLSNFQQDNKFASVRQLDRPRGGIIFYSEKRFRGDQKYLYAGEYLNFGLNSPNIDNEAQSAIVLGGEWLVCSEPGLRGQCESISAAVGDLATLGLDGKISSAKRVATSASGVELYENASFEGLMAREHNAVPDLDTNRLNDSISSVKILDSRTWLVCDLPYYRGWCQRIRGWHENLSTSAPGIDDRISSLRPLTSSEVEARGIIVYENVGRSGAQRRYTDSARDLEDDGINDAIASIWVLDGNWELCRKTRFRDCVTVSGMVEDLSSIGLNSAVSSIQRID